MDNIAIDMRSLIRSGNFERGFKVALQIENNPLEERTERVAHTNGAGSAASFEENRDDENVKPQSENTSHQDVSSSKREGVSHTSQPHKEAVDLTRSLSKLKKKIKNPLDGASISIRSSFSCSFGEMMKNKAYKEIVDEQRNEKEDDTALIENEFDLIANRKSRGGLEGILIDYTSVVELLIIEEALAISFKTTVKLSFSSFDYCI
jgi:Fe-S cluster assembly iron-binding protein IscA